MPFQDLGVVSCVVSQFRISGLGVVELPHSVEDQVGSIALLLESRAHLVRAEAAARIEFIFQLFGQPPGAETYHFERGHNAWGTTLAVGQGSRISSPCSAPRA